MTTTTTPVFVYGILLGDATERATLLGHRLAFSGNATVVPDDHAEVRGGLVTDVDAECLRRYDRIEGVGRNGDGYYRRELMRVVREDGWSVMAWVYVMNARFFQESEPYGSTLGLIEKQRERLGHPVTP